MTLEPRRITVESVRHLAAAAGVRPGEHRLEDLASALELMLAAVERCETMDLSRYEPAPMVRLMGGPIQ